MTQTLPRSEEPTMIIVGGDALALSTASEICALQGHRVVVLWNADEEFAAQVETIGAVLVNGRPDSRQCLEQAGVMEAVSFLALSRDDQLNLQAALRARDANPDIRIVLRQFNRTLAAKIEQNLPNCAVLSLAWHSAATYAASVLDPSCFRGLQFPEPNGPLTGFALRPADHDRIAGRSVAQAEHALGARIVAIDGDTAIGPDTRIRARSMVVVYGTIARLLESSAWRVAGEKRGGFGRGWRRLRRGLQALPRRRRLDPILATFLVAIIGVFAVGTWHFAHAFDQGWLKAAYFVLATMTTTGYGDITPNLDRTGDIVTSMLLMMAGTTFTGIFIALAASRLTRAQWVRLQGLRRVHRHGHIVVCGAGSIGSGVIELLLGFNKPLVVIEPNPDAAMIERARDRGFDLLTGDASRDDTLDLCQLAAAHGLVALSNIDTLNLEIALGARARNPEMPIVLRIAEATFAASIASHFDLKTTFSVAALAGPSFAGLSRLDGARGRIAFDGREFGIAELPVAADGDLARWREVWREAWNEVIPLAAGRDDEMRLIHSLDAARPGDRALLLVPFAPLRDGTQSLAQVADRVHKAQPAEPAS